MSGTIWLLDLPDCCRAAGLDVELFDGWETRSRSSGGYDDLLGVGYHHDASNANSDEGSSDAYGWLYADDKPIGAMRLHRSGQLVIGAAGATNTMGKGGPLTCSGGTVPLDRGNQTLIAIEAANNGVGEVWPAVQVDAYIALVGGLCAWYGFDPATDIYSHAEYCEPTCPGRKIDPAGPTPSHPTIGGTSGKATWSIDGFRQEVAGWIEPDPEPPKPEPPPVPQEDAMLIARDSTTGKLWIGNTLEKVTYSDDDAGYAIGMLAKAGTPMRDAGKGHAVTAVEQVTSVSDRYIRMMGTAP